MITSNVTKLTIQSHFGTLGYKQIKDPREQSK